MSRCLKNHTAPVRSILEKKFNLKMTTPTNLPWAYWRGRRPEKGALRRVTSAPHRGLLLQDLVGQVEVQLLAGEHPALALAQVLAHGVHHHPLPTGAVDAEESHEQLGMGGARLHQQALHLQHPLGGGAQVDSQFKSTLGHRFALLPIKWRYPKTLKLWGYCQAKPALDLFWQFGILKPINRGD